MVGSTLTAEALSLQVTISHAIFLRAILAEILGVEDRKLPIVCNVDSNNLYQAVYSTKFVEDKRLRLDIAQIQESVETKNVKVQ